MTRPLVLNTRPRGQAGELTSALRSAGFDVFEVPAVEIAPAWDPAEIGQVLAGLRAGRYGWAVIPSSNAGRLLLAALAEAGGTAADLARLRVLSGGATARTLSEHGLQVDMALSRFSGDAALEHLIAQGARPGGRAVLVPRGAEARQELVAGLREHGCPVDDPILYRTQAVEPGRLDEVHALLLQGRIAAVTFTSPSTVRALVAGVGSAALRSPGAPPLVCIGHTTAEAVGSLGLKVAAVARETSAVSLAEAVSLALAQRRALARAEAPADWPGLRR